MRRHRYGLGRAAAALLCATVLAVACDSPSDPAAAPANLDRVNPAGTFGGVVNSVLADSLVVRVTDASGNPAAGATVNWTVTEGGGSPTAATSLSDANGIARMTWRLGPATNVVQIANASLSAGPTAAFFARAADTITVLQGSGIIVPAGVPITASVGLVGAPGGPVPGVTVQWQVTGGGGTVTPATSKTSSTDPGFGVASTQWTPGPAPGTQTLTATAGGLTATLTVHVLITATRTLLTTVPGRVLDATTDRVLWLDESTGAFRVRTLATGADAAIATAPATAPFTGVGGWLFAGGALLANGGLLFDWRGDGTVTPLGTVDGLPSVEGDWAAWSTGAQVIRRGLSGGTNLILLGTGAASVDVGANGNVVYLAGGAWLYSGGTAPVSTQGVGTVSRIETDGVNVAYTRSDTHDASLWLDNGTNDVLLTSHSSLGGGRIYYRLNGAWIAYNTPLTAVTRRPPGSGPVQLTTETTGKQVVALGSDGTLIFEDLSRNRYRLVTPADLQEDAGPAGATFFVHGAQIFEALGGAVYRIIAA